VPPQIRVENGTDVILALLYAGGAKKQTNEEIVGNTRLYKLVFLTEYETSLSRLMKDITFEPYNYGPYSSQVFDTVQVLANAGLVKVEDAGSESYLDEADRYQVESVADDETDTSTTIKVYSLTDEGVRVGEALFNSLSDSEKKELTSIKERFNGVPLKKLLQYVYHRHPNFTTESVIRDQVA
jgi:uncharacterized protein YwgA